MWSDSSESDSSDASDEESPSIPPPVPTPVDTKAWLNASELLEMGPDRIGELVKGSFITKAPRDHQWESCQRILEDVIKQEDGAPAEGNVNKNYLIQQAAGAGKSLTIACLVYHLFMLKNGGQLKFRKILVMNDRKYLDVQLGDVIVDFLKSHNIEDYTRPQSSAHLKSALLDENCRIVITTMQKFGKLLLPTEKGGISSLKDFPTAIISDEAHRSHGRSTTRRVHEFLSGSTRQSSQITYFSFTCTPTAKCLEMFGVKRGINRCPFYVFSMKEAQQRDLTLDVLKNYTTVAVLAKIVHEGEKSVYHEGRKAAYKVIQKTSNDMGVLREKARYIVSHLTRALKRTDNSTFKGRAMLVTRSRKHILWYKKLIEEQVALLPIDERFDVVTAFSNFTYEGRAYAESDVDLNGPYARYCQVSKYGIVQALKSDANSRIRLIIVADKFQTGFDEPSLVAMYVDKRLHDANAVQTLGRLSRVAPGKTETFVVDFANTRREIADAFGIYSGSTTLLSFTRPEILQLQLQKVTAKLLDIPHIREGNIDKSVDFIIQDEAIRKQLSERSLLEDYLTQFLDCCDKLQLDCCTSLTYKFVSHVKTAIRVKKGEQDDEVLDPLLKKLQVEVEYLGESASGRLQTRGGKTSLKSSTSHSRRGRDCPMSSLEIVQNANMSYRSRLVDILVGDNDDVIWMSEDSPNGAACPEWDSSNLEFAQQLWGRPPTKIINTPTSAIANRTVAPPTINTVAIVKPAASSNIASASDVQLPDNQTRPLHKEPQPNPQHAVIRSLVSILSSESQLPPAKTQALKTLTAMCVANSIAEASKILFEVDFISLLAAFLANFDRMGEELVLQLLTSLATSEENICTAVRNHPGIQAQLPRLLCSQDPQISTAANSLQKSFQPTNQNAAKQSTTPINTTTSTISKPMTSSPATTKTIPPKAVSISPAATLTPPSTTIRFKPFIPTTSPSLLPTPPNIQPSLPQHTISPTPNINKPSSTPPPRISTNLQLNSQYKPTKSPHFISPDSSKPPYRQQANVLMPSPTLTKPFYNSNQHTANKISANQTRPLPSTPLQRALPSYPIPSTSVLPVPNNQQPSYPLAPPMAPTPTVPATASIHQPNALPQKISPSSRAPFSLPSSQTHPTTGQKHALTEPPHTENACLLQPDDTNTQRNPTIQHYSNQDQLSANYGVAAAPKGFGAPPSSSINFKKHTIHKGPVQTSFKKRKIPGHPTAPPTMPTNCTSFLPPNT